MSAFPGTIENIMVESDNCTKGNGGDSIMITFFFQISKYKVTSNQGCSQVFFTGGDLYECVVCGCAISTMPYC